MTYVFCTTGSRPETVYRIYDDSSVSQYSKDSEHGFWAGRAVDSIQQPTRLREAVELHTDHHNRQLTPFISASSDGNWISCEAMRREDEGCENIRIAQIDLTGSNFADDLERPAFKGENVDLYNLEKLIQDVGATISESTRQRCKHEWLFVGRIPKETIHNVFTVKEFSSYLEYLDFDVNDYDFGFNVDPFY